MEPTHLAAAGIVLVGALSPGPNNLVVLREATRGGLPAVWRPIGGIAAGTFALVLVCSAALGPVRNSAPTILPGVAMLGSAYLAYLGLRLARPRPIPGSGDEVELSGGIRGLFVFQFLNPKAWILVVTVVSTLGPGAATGRGLVLLAFLFGVLPVACLLPWAGLGAAARRLDAAQRLRGALDRLFGILLLALAGWLLVHTLLEPTAPLWSSP